MQYASMETTPPPSLPQEIKTIPISCRKKYIKKEGGGWRHARLSVNAGHSVSVQRVRAAGSCARTVPDNARRRLLISSALWRRGRRSCRRGRRVIVGGGMEISLSLSVFFPLFGKLGDRMTFKGTYSCANQDIRALARGSSSTGSRLCSRLLVCSVLSSLTVVGG